MRKSTDHKGYEFKGRHSYDLLRLRNMELRLAIEVGDRIVCHSYQLPSRPTWTGFESFLKEKFDTVPNFTVKYRDEDGEEVPLETEKEFFEALKVYKKIGSVLMLHLIPINNDVTTTMQPTATTAVDGDGLPAAKRDSLPSTSGSSAADKLTRETSSSESSSWSLTDHPAVTSAESNDIVETGCRPKEQLQQSSSPPEWFTGYMEKFKGDITAEITKKVMHRMRRIYVAQPGTVGAASSQQQQAERPDLPVPDTSTSAVTPADQLTPSGENNTTFDAESHYLPTHPVHTGIFCDGCGDQIVGVRYKCGNCVKFDLCETCEGIEHIHDRYHVFVKIRRPCSTAGLRKKTGVMAPLFRHMLYQDNNNAAAAAAAGGGGGGAGGSENNNNTTMTTPSHFYRIVADNARNDREKKLLKRLEKQARKLEHYREKFRPHFYPPPAAPALAASVAVAGHHHHHHHN